MVDFLGQARKKQQTKVSEKQSFTTDNAAYDDQEVILLDTFLVHPDPNQPRKHRTEEQRDAVRASYTQHLGNHTPITVRLHPDIPNEYMIIVGEGRWSMCHELGFKVKAIISRKEWTDAEVLSFQISENLHRDDLDLLDECNALSRYQEMTGASYEEIALNFGIGTIKTDGKTTGRTKVSRKIKVAREITEKVKKLVEDGVTSSINSIVYLISLESSLSESEFDKVYSDVIANKLNEKSLQKLSSAASKTGTLPEAKETTSNTARITNSSPSEDSDHESNSSHGVDAKNEFEDVIDSNKVASNQNVDDESLSDKAPMKFDEIETFEKVDNGALIKIKNREDLILLSVADLQQLAELYSDF